MVNEQSSAMLDYLAREAMKSLIAKEGYNHNTAQKAYQLAYSMLDERQKMQEYLAKKLTCKTPIRDWLVNGLLSIRSHNCLAAEGIDYAEQLQECTERQLLKIPNMGRKSLNEIIQVMESCGFYLKQKIHHD